MSEVHLVAIMAAILRGTTVQDRLVYSMECAVNDAVDILARVRQHAEDSEGYWTFDFSFPDGFRVKKLDEREEPPEAEAAAT